MTHGIPYVYILIRRLCFVAWWWWRPVHGRPGQSMPAAAWEYHLGLGAAGKLAVLFYPWSKP